MQARALPRPVAADDRSRLIWLRAAAVAATLGALAVVAPLVWTMVSAGVGLLALAAVGLAGAALLQALPWLMQRLENRLLVLRKAEAHANPIEQLQNDVLRREERLRSFRQALVSIGAQIESMAQMIETRRQTDPGHALQRQQRALERMTRFHTLNLDRLAAAHQALDAFRHQVQQKVFEWDFHVAGKQVLQLLNPTEQGELMHSLLSDEALRSVQQRFNEVFAELDIDLRAADAPTRALLEAAPREALEALAPVLPQPRSAR